MTLQPMTTAPRDGSEVWVMPRLRYLCACQWDSETESWISLDGEEYHDAQVNGWLDLAALVQDSERLRWQAEHPHRTVSMVCSRAFSRDDIDIDIWRAAIDKEAGRD